MQSERKTFKRHWKPAKHNYIKLKVNLCLFKICPTNLEKETSSAF